MKVETIPWKHHHSDFTNVKQYVSINNQPSSIAVFAVPSLATSQFLMSINIYKYLYIYIYTYIHTVYITVHNIPEQYTYPLSFSCLNYRSKSGWCFQPIPRKRVKLDPHPSHVKPPSGHHFNFPKKSPLYWWLYPIISPWYSILSHDSCPVFLMKYLLFHSNIIIPLSNSWS